MNVGSVSQPNLIAPDASRLKARPTRSTTVEQDSVAPLTRARESLAPKTLARDVEPTSRLTDTRLDSTLAPRLSGQKNPQPQEQEARLPARHAAVQQKAIDFYNITASLGNAGGEGELIGVDTYA